MTYQERKGQLVKALADFFEQDYRRIGHAIEVLQEAEKLLTEHPGADAEVLLASALLHDVGIKPSEERLGYNNGQTQEELGPPVASRILQHCGFTSCKIPLVAAIIGNHHSPSRIAAVELEILKQADRVVNRRSA
ncbi:HD domain-containing protein [Desulfuromonas thiophila]|uniref:Metal dependent phosphohydrolase n=1 Tax=Desulfuromonas thiophila TaxID=57664 RepID=A0A1G6XCF7_9BACT|nr:HD domain-containing protein [Desulfuromonas thiophila]SDD75838.1 metal dependent phosphohydrolase [Desulfuromonas thiophila]